MTIRKLSLIFYLVTWGLISLLIFFIVLRSFEQRELNHVQGVRYTSFIVADKLRQSIDDLTRMARTYVDTGDPKFESFFWQILAIRKGEMAEPLHYERGYWDLVIDDPNFQPGPEGQKISLRTQMEGLGFTEEEFAKLKVAENKSNQLVLLPYTAFNAMKGLFQGPTGHFDVKGAPDPELARRLLNDENYHDAKAKIMRRVKEFYELLDTRTLNAVTAAQHRTDLYAAGLRHAYSAGSLARSFVPHRVAKSTEPGASRRGNPENWERGLCLSIRDPLQ